MKIDEAIEHSRYVAEKIRKEEGLCVDDLNAHNCQDCLECAKEHEQLAEWLEELKWYREQDLIKREDVKAIFNECIWDWQCCGTEEAYDELLELPKAEPPFATDTNVGDKECHYCKHNLNDKECKECNFESLV